MEFRIACGRGDEILPYIQKYPSYVNCIGPAGWTPLFYAVRSNQIEVVKVLLKHGADPTVRDKYGFTIVDIATQKEYTELVDLLKIEMVSALHL
jgi:ankyrin repeat protein